MIMIGLSVRSIVNEAKELSVTHGRTDLPYLWKSFVFKNMQVSWSFRNIWILPFDIITYTQTHPHTHTHTDIHVHTHTYIEICPSKGKFKLKQYRQKIGGEAWGPFLACIHNIRDERLVNWTKYIFNLIIDCTYV